MLRNLVLILATSLLAACASTSTVEDSIAAIDQSIAEGDYTAAQDKCNRLLTETGYDALTPEQLCHMSITYLKLSEQTDEASNAATAVHCYQAANKADSLRVLDYFATLPPEDLQYVFLIDELTSQLFAPDSVAPKSAKDVFDEEDEMLFRHDEELHLRHS